MTEVAAEVAEVIASPFTNTARAVMASPFVMSLRSNSYSSRRRSIAEEDLQEWSSFLPAIGLRQLSAIAPVVGDAEAEAEAQLQGLEGFGSTFEAAALFADASGFTQLTEKLSTLPDGAERMCDAMNRFLTQVINCVHEHGGDVVKFAGDAVSVIFPLDDARAAADKADKSALKTAAVLATACALELHKRVHGFVAWTDKDATQYTLSLHIGVGVGRVTMLHLGGNRARCEIVLAGPPMTQSAAAEPLAHSGETCLSPEAWALVGELSKGTPLEEETPSSAPDAAPSTAPSPQATSAAVGSRWSSSWRSSSAIEEAGGGECAHHDAFMLVHSINAASVTAGAVPRALPHLREPLLPFMRRYVPLAAALKLGSGAGSSGVRADLPPSSLRAPSDLPPSSLRSPSELPPSSL